MIDNFTTSDQTNPMSVLKILTLNFFLFIEVVAYGQLKVDTTEIFQLRQTRNFKERNTFKEDTNLIFTQEVLHNESNAIDEEFSHVLTVTLVAKFMFGELKNFDIQNDSLVIKCSYDRLSVWNWSEEETTIKGQVKLISRTKNKIKLEFNVTVEDTEKGKVYVYYGKRKFYRIKISNAYSYLYSAKKGLGK